MLPCITNADCPFFWFWWSKKSPISIHRKRAALDKVKKVKVKLLHHSGCSFSVFIVESYFTPSIDFVNRIAQISVTFCLPLSNLFSRCLSFQHKHSILHANIPLKIRIIFAAHMQYAVFTMIYAPSKITSSAIDVDCLSPHIDILCSLLFTILLKTMHPGA